MSDKHTVSTDALATLGTIIDDEASRDAIHVAVRSCKAGEKLFPGQDIGLHNGRAYGNLTNDAMVGPYLGIVDPFLKTAVLPGENFWMLIYPRMITSLRHVWQHPAFDDEIPGDRAASETWLRNYCERCIDFATYEEIVRVALGEDVFVPDGHGGTNILRKEGDEYIISFGQDARGEIPSEFWDHLEIVTGKKITSRPKFFTCSC